MIICTSSLRHLVYRSTHSYTYKGQWDYEIRFPQAAYSERIWFSVYIYFHSLYVMKYSLEHYLFLLAVLWIIRRCSMLKTRSPYSHDVHLKLCCSSKDLRSLCVLIISNLIILVVSERRALNLYIALYVGGCAVALIFDYLSWTRASKAVNVVSDLR